MLVRNALGMQALRRKLNGAVGIKFALFDSLALLSEDPASQVAFEADLVRGAPGRVIGP